MARAATSIGPRTKPLAALLTIATLAGLSAACDRPSLPPQPRADASVSRTTSSESARPAAAQNEAKPEPSPPATPAKEMTSEEESKTMPQPGQANDHSTLTRDRERSAR